MSDDICGVPLKTREDVCNSTITDDEGEYLYPDKKCGIHSKHSNFNNQSKEPKNELIAEFLTNQNGKVSTQGSVKSACIAFDEWLQEEGIEPKVVMHLDIEEWIAEFLQEERGVADSTIGQYVYGVSKFYKWLIKESERAERHGKEGYGIKDNPVHEADIGKNLDSPGVSERQKALGRKEYFPLSEEEMKEMIEYAQGPDPFRSQLIMKILAQCGLRPHELQGLKLKDVTESTLWENNRIRVHSTKTERYQEENNQSGIRTVRYNDGLQFYLHQWLEGGYRDSYLMAEESDYLFPTNRSEKITRDVIDRIVNKAAEACNLQGTLYTDAQGNDHRKVIPYSFRHGFGTKLASEGYPPAKLARLMGSDQETISKYYVDLREEQLDGASELVPDV